MSNEKEYELPDDLLDKIIRAAAAEKLRNLYVKRPFGFRKARKNALACERYRHDFWSGVRLLYPELVGETLVWSLGDKFLAIKD